jgi:hypothetical protein
MILSIGTWLLLSAFSLIIVLLLRGMLGAIWRVVRPMWLPVAVMAAAGVVLFFTDQGLELGVGIVGGNWQQLVLLGLALLYWAVGTWQAGRLGLNRAFLAALTVPGCAGRPASWARAPTCLPRWALPSAPACSSIPARKRCPA